MVLVSFASIPVWDLNTNRYSCIIKVPVNHPFTFYKTVTTKDISSFDYVMTIIPNLSTLSLSKLTTNDLHPLSTI
jgi:hypothetical protein